MSQARRLGLKVWNFELKNELPAAANASCGVQEEEEDLPSSSVIIGIDFLSMQFSRTFDKRSNRLETSSSAKKGLVQPPCGHRVENGNFTVCQILREIKYGE